MHSRLRDFDWALFIAAVLLSLIGLAAVYSAGQTSDTLVGGVLARRHLMRIALGMVAMFAAVLVPNRVYESLAYLLYPVALGGLVLVYLLEGDNPRGDRWIQLGPVNLEPSELAKLAVILALARYLTGRSGRPSSLRRLPAPFAIVLLPMGLVMLQPDLGTSLVLAGVLLPMLYWAGLDPLYGILLVTPIVSLVSASALTTWSLFLGCVVAIIYFGRRRLQTGPAILVLLLNLTIGVGAPFVWGRLQDYQKERILTFLDPSRDPLGAGYQILQSKVALGSGGLFGKGYLAGTQKALSFLPAQHTDFIFSVVGEEFGFLGSVVVLGLFFLVIWRMLALAGQSRNRFGGLIAVGIASSLTIHVVVNVGMTMGLVPVTGLPLPLLSFGGSSLVTTLAAVGIVLNVGLHRKEY